MLKQIVTGGQTGVDRAALDAALNLGFPIGGWCPRGRKAEDGRLADRYTLRETPTDDYAERTVWNVRDSDATLIVTVRDASGGTGLTIDVASGMRKPLRHVRLPDPAAVEQTASWIDELGVHILNVAGPRASEEPEVYPLAYAFVRALLARCTRGE